MNPNLGINDKDRAGVVKILNALLADEYVLYTKTRNYHWNVVGPQFNDLHKFFAEQYEAIDDFVDDVAERARTLGGHAVATLSEFAEAARLKEHPGLGQEIHDLDLLLGRDEIGLDLEPVPGPHFTKRDTRRQLHGIPPDLSVRNCSTAGHEPIEPRPAS